MIEIPVTLKPENFVIKLIDKNENLKKIDENQENPAKKHTIRQLRKLFFIEFRTLFNREFELTKESNELLQTILSYFLKDERFFNSPCLIIPKSATPSFDKGLLIMGNTGTGKTSILKALEQVFNIHFIYDSKTHFKPITAYQMVNEFEKLKTPEEREDFFMKHKRGFRFYDDVKSEDDASNYGKVNLFKKILHQRNEKRLRTIMTCNYDPSFPNNFEKGLDEFGNRYDERIYDRLFSDFNFIQAGGKSFR
jgi:hypothetical protein